VRPVRGAPSWEFNDWFDRYYEDTHVVEPPRAKEKPPVYDALAEEQDRSPIVRFMSGAGPGVEADPDAPSMFPSVRSIE